MNFEGFFHTATRSGRCPDGLAPYGYQRKLACGDEAPGDSSGSGIPCRSQLMAIPTGLGKTAAVVLAWLWNRVNQQRPDWPRRLVYCLPMRTLVEQTERDVKKWLANLGLSTEVNVHLLMGGEEKTDWDLHPEKNAILIGTQDMLLSRALNRGYGMSRYRWPMHFGLLNNDTLWVMDETQLMGVGMETSAQLDGFRHERPGIGSFTWWMSATLDQKRLSTVNHPEPSDGWNIQVLSGADLATEPVQKRINASKPLSKAPPSTTLDPATKGNYARNLAAFIREKHKPGRFTLVVLNRVQRAQEVYKILRDAKTPPADNIALIHSRFRPLDRADQQAALDKTGDRIVIATQAIEAGVDISADLLVTELAPWSSLVQRFGRCNRAGESADAEVFWIDIRPKDEKDELNWPYDFETLAKARAAIEPLTDAGTTSIRNIKVAEKPIIRPVIRRKDLVDLFDTTPDLCGNDLDISRYIRDGEDIDVQVYWRPLNGEPKPEDQSEAPSPDELCRVPIHQFTKFVGKTVKAYAWNPLEERWDTVRRPRPGGVYLLDVASGGYTPNLGWTGVAKVDPKDRITIPSASGKEPNPAYGGDRETCIKRWLKLEKHTADVVGEIVRITNALGLNGPEAEALHTAALWHDIGKAHPSFQEMLNPEDRKTLWAKSDSNSKRRTQPPGFRHELASALAWLKKGPPDAPEHDLVAYLIAAHHGKVRLSIRALPNERPPGDKPPDTLIARGVVDGDQIPGPGFEAIRLDGLTLEPLTLDLGYMQLGADRDRGSSWLARTTALRNRFGPFHLAYMETLLRAADMQASKKEANGSAAD